MFLVSIGILVGILCIPLSMMMVICSSSFFNKDFRKISLTIITRKAKILETCVSIWEPPIKSITYSKDNKNSLYFSYKSVGFGKYKVVQNNTQYSDGVLEKHINSSILIFI